jgi:hypothetical protein
MSKLYVNQIVEANAGNGVQISGHVVQVVNVAYNTGVTTSVVGGAIETGLAATITPKFSTSKILILANQNIQVNGSSYAQIVLRKGTIASNTILAIMSSPEGYTNSSSESINTIPMCYEDSPATISATRYFCSMELLSGSSMYAQTSTSGTSVSTMTLMEIAQ